MIFLADCCCVSTVIRLLLLYQPQGSITLLSVILHEVHLAAIIMVSETMDIAHCTVYHRQRERLPFYMTFRSDLWESQCLQIGQIKQIFLSETGIKNSGSLGK